MEEDKIFFNIKEACQTVFGWENIEIEDACKNLEAHKYSGSSIISPLECPKRSQNESSVDVSKVHNLDIHCYPEPMIQVIKKHDRQIFTFDEYEILEINKIMKRVKKSSEKPNKEDSISNRPSIDELKMCLSLLEAVKICIDSKQKEKRDKQRKGTVRFRLP